MLIKCPVSDLSLRPVLVLLFYSVALIRQVFVKSSGNCSCKCSCRYLASRSMLLLFKTPTCCEQSHCHLYIFFGSTGSHSCFCSLNHPHSPFSAFTDLSAICSKMCLLNLNVFAKCGHITFSAKHCDVYLTAASQWCGWRQMQVNDSLCKGCKDFEYLRGRTVEIKTDDFSYSYSASISAERS
jgi:hypothetical protein